MPFYLEPMSKGLATTSYWAHSWTSQHCSKWTICCSTIVIAHMNLVIRCSSRNRDGNRQPGTHIGSRQGIFRDHRHGHFSATAERVTGQPEIKIPVATNCSISGSPTIRKVTVHAQD